MPILGQSSEFHERFMRFFRRNASAGHRSLLVLSGDRDLALAYADTWVRQSRMGALLISDRPIAGVLAEKPMQPGQIIGRETDVAVIDAWSGFDPDVFGAVSGTVKGGGALILCCPGLAQWPDFEDPEKSRMAVHPGGAAVVTGKYLQRLSRILEKSPAAFIADPADFRGCDPGMIAVPEDEANIIVGDDQSRAVDAVLHVLEGQRRRPAVIRADRGRGKSASLGLAAACLMKNGCKRIVVTAVRASAVATVFRHAADELGEVATTTGNSRLESNGNVLEYRSVDELLALETKPDLVLVDEAAGLPLFKLEKLLKKFSRIAFATTVHGYEGSGRGFALRFNRMLEANSRGWKTIHMTRPVRWSASDPLELLSFECLLLDAEACDDSALREVNLENCEAVVLDRGDLARDEKMLRQVYGLLVQSHYRTRPYDLRHLLDGSNLEIIVLRYGTDILATAVVVYEGGFDEATSEQVWQGRRRPHGHILAESLSVHLGEHRGPKLRGLRVMRIAVHPVLQRRGLGSRLMRFITGRAVADGIDYVGSSFSLGPDIIRFWQGNGFGCVRISTKPNAQSGSHSLMVLQPLTPEAIELSGRVRTLFVQTFLLQLPGLFQNLDAQLVVDVLRESSIESACDELDFRSAGRFAAGAQPFEAAFLSLWRIAGMVMVSDHNRISTPDYALSLLTAAVLQQRSLFQVAITFGWTGRAEVLERLRKVYDVLTLNQEYSVDRYEPDATI